MLTLSQVWKTYGREARPAVAGVDFTVQAGEFFALLGPSGCGKTTTLRLIAGFETPDRGDIRLGDRSLLGLPPFRRPVHTVFQNYALFPHLTVARNIAFGLEMRGVSRREIRSRVGEMLALVRLDGLAHRYPRELSGGQQQRVALARALIQKPQVLLLDEPLGALDLKLRRQMQSELKQMQQQLGITFLYVTHDQEEALTLADRLAVMQGGRLLQVGTPQQVYEHPTSYFVADFIGESNFLPGTVVEHHPPWLLVRLTNDHLVRVHHSEPTYSPGAEVTLMIRPEKVHLQPGTADSTAHLLSADYLGLDTRYTVQMAGGLTVRVRQAGSGLQVGEPVEVTLPPHALRVVSLDPPVGSSTGPLKTTAPPR
ncbi:MAG: ABC transporter ATP-binding protein [Gloeomargarita sp. SKYBB_i_bin120]|nr:ABC transporter ATP-binding protein [Gloeomargarita sp. SKYG98]MCS7292270.1 ABC transporter ATP-binding protein [Gloeomargarita sp. SKYB120]MDW8177831.1 ABC transporter ATP-binding protein [Gloeomargarita sp. SKYBB_i_bin120]